MKALLGIPLLMSLVLSNTALVRGQSIEEEADTHEPPVPLAVVNFASLDRLLSDTAYVINAGGRPELMDWLGEGLAALQNLDGVDRTRPFGALLFLGTSLPPSPKPVAYIPVEDRQKLLKTLGMNNTLWKKSGTVEDRYSTVDGPDLHIQFRGDYAFLVPEDDSLLDEVLPDPIAYNATLTDRYDAAVAIRIGTVPEAIRKVFVGYLRANSEVELQRRDGEPETAYRIRRAQGMSIVDFIAQVLTEGDQLTLGWDASAEQRQGVLELSIDAKPNSDFARYLTDISGQKSSFHAMFDEKQPLCLSASWELRPMERDAYLEIATAMRDDVELRLLEQNLPADAVPGLFDAIDATIESGHVDFCLQFAAPEEGRFVLLGGIKVVGGRTFGQAWARMLDVLRDHPDIAAIELNVDSHEDISFHRLRGKNASADDERMYGGAPSLYLGCSDRALWFAIGTSGATAYLKPIIDAVRRAEAEPQLASSNAPFQMIARISSWLKLPQAPPQEQAIDDTIEGTVAKEGKQDKGNPRQPQEPGWRRQLAQEAFSGDDDALRIEARPTENGGRIRIQFDESFLRFIALRLGREYDRSQL